VQRLDGGLTNRNYKVSTPAGTFVARVFSRGAELLAINRDHEYRNTAAAAAAGAAAPVIEYRPEAGVLVIGYIEGRTLANADVSAPGNIPRIARACRRLHAAQPFGNDFNMFDIQRRYLALVLARRFRLPAGDAALMPRFDAIRRALAAHPAALVPCNNDLLAGNFIDDGDRIWLIDYEYSYIRHSGAEVMTADLARSGSYQVNVGGELCPATVHLRPPFDPAGRRIKGI
jgi:thiamine kinase-like enzyme